MKLIIYELTDEGNIPEYVIDGGYFHNSNGMLVGLAEDDAPQDLMTKESFVEYLSSFCADFVDPITQEVVSVETLANNFWADKMQL